MDSEKLKDLEDLFASLSIEANVWEENSHHVLFRLWPQKDSVVLSINNLKEIKSILKCDDIRISSTNAKNQLFVWGIW